jgi:threonine synthase
MSLNSYLADLECSSCSRMFSAHHVQTYCPDCSAPLLARYELTKAKSELDRDKFVRRPKNMWRWFELLPVFDQKNIVTLGEGDTSLLQLQHLRTELGLSHLYLKDEGINPTGSFKARGMSSAVSKAIELGIQKLVIPSAGNAGGALAAYAARAGMQAMVIMPKSAPKTNIIECEIMGSAISLVDGLIDIASKAADQVSMSEDWFNLSTFKEPYRVEGKKIMGYEIAEQLGWKLPDVVIYPTGGGTGLVGMWKAFHELKALGWLESNTLPRLISVQAEDCAPVVRAIESNMDYCERWENAKTIATGLCVPKSFADRLILKDIRESHGTAISVSDHDISHWQEKLAQLEGIYSCPEGAATLAAVDKLIKEKKVDPEESVVVFNTASGIKYINK